MCIGKDIMMQRRNYQMIDYLVKLITRWEKLYLAIADEVELQNMIGRVTKDPVAMETASCYWDEADGWRGWTKNYDMNRYFFNDIPEHGWLDATFALDEMEGVVRIA